MSSLHSGNQTPDRSLVSLLRDKQVLSWALYDWANSAFATTVLAGFFPLYFKQYWSAGVSVADSTARLGFAHGAIGLTLGLASPFLGWIADRKQKKKLFLFLFTLLGVWMTASLALIPQGQWLIAIAVSGLATLGFIGAQNFYDSLIVAASRSEDLNRVSAIGYSLGYLGGGLLFAINVFMVLSPASFGIAPGPQQVPTAIQWSFISVAIWWAAFSTPLFWAVQEPAIEVSEIKVGATDNKAAGLKNSIFSLNMVFSGLTDTLQKISEQRNLKLFLLGYFFYIDGINTIIKMSVDYGLSLGFSSDHLIKALLIVQFVGFPATLIYGKWAQKIGPRKPLAIGLVAYVLATALASQMQTVEHFYLLACFIGLVQGGVQALSRSLYASLIPAADTAAYFGFYNLIGRFSSILGPTLIGVAALITPNPRLTLLSVLSLLITGLILLVKSDSSSLKM